MPCYHPASGFWTGAYTDKHKKDIIYERYGVNKLSLQYFNLKHSKKHKYDLTAKDNNGNLLWTVVDNDYWLNNMIPLPCGNCVGCQLDKSKKWAIRLMKESQYYANNYFVTLTFDDDHLGNNNLSKRDLQLYLKRLRKQCSELGYENIRFFACGEYGSKTGRKHYHLILMNMPKLDLKFYKGTSLKNTLYNSKFMSDLWKYGHTVIGEVSWESCAYVARYCMKKIGVNNNTYKELNLQPPFITMSTKPGIGNQFFEDNYEKIYKTDQIFYKHNEKTYSISSFGYFDKLAERKNIDLEPLKAIRENRAVNRNALILENTDMEEYELFEYNENLHQSKANRLTRSNF